MAGESTFSAQITNLVGGATIDEEFCDDAAQDACKEIINQLPVKLKAKCSTISIINATNGTTLDLDGKGDILSITRLSASSGGYYLPCREIPAQYGDLANDSTDLNYFATASDPVYYITSNTSDAFTLFVKPTATDAQPANAYHISYPTVDVSASTVEIANFPDEATYLVVLFAATRQLLKFQATMSASFNSNINTALGAITKELDKADNNILIAYNKIVDYYTEIAFLENDDLWDDTNKRFDEVKLSLENAMSLIGFTTTGDKYDAGNDLEAVMVDIESELNSEDIDLAGARMQQAQTQMNAVSSHLSTAQMAMSEINGLTQKHSLPLAGVPQLVSTASGYISQAAGYVGEANARLGADNAKYQWYGDQYAKLSAEYGRGLAALKGGGAQPGGGE